MFPDELDHRLLQELKIDSRRSVRQLAKSLNESPSTIYNRVKRLESKSVIRRWTVTLDYDQLDLETTAFVFINLDTNVLNGDNMNIRDIFDKIKGISGIYEMHVLSGEYDILLKIRSDCAKSVGKLVIDKIRQIRGVTRTITSLTIETIVEEGELTNTTNGK
ncbi:MAG: Lrp/AsnC family transcriptional regulator [Candidatus Kariarchaeaceae archaeon]|jgi:DNA-binding Lrp family transcriptional regulator